MQTREAITTRRSIRHYDARPVSEEIVNDLLRAAMSAPSACNQQPWEFVVLDDPAVLKEIPTLNEHAEMCAEAPVAILVCADPRRETCPGNWMLDCSAAAQTLLLAAHDAGLGAVWTGVFPNRHLMEVFRKRFGMPEEVVPLALIPIGYPAEKPTAEDRFRPDRIHRNRW